MSRLTSVALVAALAGVAAAQSQAEIASRANDDGKQLMYENKYPEATAKFREAVARVPEAKYFFNLCTSLFQEGKFDEAITACNAVGNNNPTPEQKEKADKLQGRIKDEAAAQHVTLHPGGSGGGGGDTNIAADPNNPPPDPNTNNPNVGVGQPTGFAPAVGRPPSQGVFTATKPDNRYTWTLGIDLFGGGGQIGQKDVYGNTAGGFRLKGDYLINPASRVGAEAYLQYSRFGAGSDQSSRVSALDVLDVGIGAYKHFCLADRVCLTPLVGVQLAFMGPEGDTDVDGSQLLNYLGVGARGELNLSVAFGNRNEHVLQVMAGANVYSKALQSPSDEGGGLGSAMDVGLDKGGVVGYVGLGYTYRFNTPLGRSPFVTLE